MRDEHIFIVSYQYLIVVSQLGCMVTVLAPMVRLLDSHVYALRP